MINEEEKRQLIKEKINYYIDVFSLTYISHLEEYFKQLIILNKDVIDEDKAIKISQIINYLMYKTHKYSPAYNLLWEILIILSSIFGNLRLLDDVRG